MSDFNESLARASSPSKLWLEMQGSDSKADALYVAARLVITAGLFYLPTRFIGNVQSTVDVRIFLAIFIFTTWRTAYNTLSVLLPPQAYMYILCSVLVQICVALSTHPSDIPTSQPPNLSVSQFLKPLIFPCRTTHTRLFPTKHSFSYSYLLVGIPVGWQGSAGSLLSSADTRSARTWFSVYADDYLARGTHPLGLQGKLHDYLSSQGVSAERYPHAYLVTAPRFLGFSFNPVSFWYLYDQRQTLSAMILEVNNTFDERRMYLMQRDGDSDAAAQTHFSHEWTKDFHVSPFNDRDGSYSLEAKDWISPDMGFRIDNNIVLRSDEKKAKVVARIFSTESAVDPARVSRVQVWSFLAKWWWVGFMTNPRILKEARVLWVKKLQVFYRPEVRETSIGRNETTEESELEPLFCEYLKSLVCASHQSISILYTPAAGAQRGRVVEITNESGDGTPQCVAVQILTPAFYDELVRLPSIYDVFDKFCFAPAEGQSMVYASDQTVLQRLLQDMKPSFRSPSSLTLRERFVARVRNVGIMRTLAPTIIQAPVNAPSVLSEFDLYVKATFSSSAYQSYFQIVTRQLVADRIALGWTSLLRTYFFLLRMLVTLSFARNVGTRDHSRSSIFDAFRIINTATIFHLVRTWLVV